MSTVQIRHPDYNRRRFGWRTVRDAKEGSGAIKRANTVYLPMPSGMEGATSVSQYQMGNTQNSMFMNLQQHEDYSRLYDPSSHSNGVYQAYKKRARFPGITGFLCRGLMGLATLSQSELDLGNGIPIHDIFITRDGKSIDALYYWVLSQSLDVARSLMLLDVDPLTNTLYISTYKAEQIVNWKEEEGRPVMINIEEWIDNTDCEFSHEQIPRNLVLKINDQGNYVVDVYEDGVFIETREPSFMGHALNFIPAVVTGASFIGLDCDDSPMLPVAEIAVQIYQKDADLANAQFLTCNPTLHYTGVSSNSGDHDESDNSEVPATVGSNVVVALDNPEAKAFYPKSDSTALDHVNKTKNELMDEAMQYGMSMLANGKKQAESAEALRLRQTATGATLVDIVDTVEIAINMILSMAAIWSGREIDTSEFKADRMFAKASMTAAERQALLQAWLAGAISFDSYFDKMKEDGSIPKHRTKEEELKLIEENPPSVRAVNEPAAIGNESQIAQNPTKATGGQ